MAINFDALLDSYKVLSVFFVVIIFIINCLLIFKTVKKGGFLYNPKNLTLISLAIGDIFLAVFSLVVEARFFFEGNEYNPALSTVKSSIMYLTYFIHFVYGIGLVSLAVELVYRYKSQHPVGNTTVNNIVKSVAFSGVPWVLGLIVILPLTTVDTDVRGVCNFLKGQYRCQAMYGVSVLLPAVMAVVACFVVMCIRLVPVAITSQAVSYQGNTPGVVIATHNTTTMPQQYQVNGVAGAQQTSPALPVTYYNHVNNQNSHLGSQENSQPQQYQTQQYHPPPYPAQQYQPTQYPAQQYLPPPYPAHQYLPPSYPAPQYLPPPYPAQQYLPPPYPVQQYLPPQYPVQQQIVQSNVIIATPAYSAQPQNTTSPALQDPGREKNVLLTVSITYFLCVVPFAAFMIGLTDGVANGTYMPGSTDTVVLAALFWLAVFRSLITPIVWMAYSTN